jgi:hypothetical protein
MPPDKFGNPTLGEAWEQHVETPVAEKFDEQRAGMTPEERRDYDTKVGMAKGAYHFGKSTLTGLVDVAMYVTNMITGNSDTWGKTVDTAWNLTKGLARETYISQFGSPAEIQDQNDRFLAVPKGMYDAFMSEWESAKSRGKQDEFIARYTVQGIFEFLSLFIGMGELKALGKAGAANEIIHDASIVAKCPKMLARDKAAAEAARKAAEVADAQRTAKAVDAIDPPPKAPDPPKPPESPKRPDDDGPDWFDDDDKTPARGTPALGKAVPFKPGPGTLTEAELKELQAIADRHGAPLDVIGSRAKGTGRNIDTTLPTEGKGPGTRSDIDVRIDGQHDIDSGGRLSNDIANASNGAGTVASATGGASKPPVIIIRPGQPPMYIPE